MLSLLSAAAATSQSPPWVSALAITGGGLVFTVVGFLLYTDYRGGRRWLLSRAEASRDGAPFADSLRKFNTKVFFGGDPLASADSRSNGMPFVVGGIFLAMGSVTLLVGLLIDVTSLVKVL